MMELKDIESIQHLKNEYELQQALQLDRRLRLLVKEDKNIKPLHDKLVGLIEEYEEKVWSDSESITDTQIEASEKAEQLMEIERKFIEERKAFIRKKLKSFDMTQTDLGVLLGHKKSYMSELINGVTQFSMKDLVIIHRVLGVELKRLIPTYLQNETREQVKSSIAKLNKPKLSLRKKDLLLR